MTSFTCYRLRDTLGGVAPQDLDDYIDDEETPRSYGPLDMGDFVAKLYVSETAQHHPSWQAFLGTGFGVIDELPMVASTGAALVLSLQPEGQHFAFTFGTLGRFLLKGEAWRRGYGLQAALNLIYPRGDSSSAGKLVGVKAKRRGATVMRSQQQASKATSFEAFAVDKIRDLMGGATGAPGDRSWGRRVTGADALHFDTDVPLAELGKLCRNLQEVHDRDDYTEKFGWIDRIRPVHDPVLLLELEEHLAARLNAGHIADLDLAPPEVVDWTAVTGFRYHFEARKKFQHPELRIQDYLRGLARAEERPPELDAAFLRRSHLWAVDGDSRLVHKWPVWRCLTGEFEHKGLTYVIEEGEIFGVSPDYLILLNESVAAVPLRTDIAWPPATSSTTEDAFNRAAVASIQSSLLMDKQLVSATTQTTSIEVCDILTSDRRLMHVKRHLGSSDLSHLFSQGYVSARLLQEDAAFRKAAAEKIASLPSGGGFAFLEASSLKTEDFEVIFVIVASWRGRSVSQGLPFFSKVNLDRTVQELANRGYRIALSRVDTG